MKSEVRTCRASAFGTLAWLSRHTKPGTSTSNPPSPNPFLNSSANRRHEWYSHDNYRYHFNRPTTTTYGQATSDMPRPYTAI